MKEFFEFAIMLFKQGSKNGRISTAIALALVLFSVWFTTKFSYYKGNIDRIPTIEKTLNDHDKVIQMIPNMSKSMEQMADDIRWLTRNRTDRKGRD